MAVIVADASVVIATLDAEDAHHRSARAALGEAWSAREPVVIPAVAYAEAMVRPLAVGGKPLQRAEAFFATQTIEPLTAAAARAAAVLRARHRSLRMPDALILGSALDLTADVVVTADERWAELDAGLRIRVIRPD
jgi:predicted nucleic acid-binding protein